MHWNYEKYSLLFIPHIGYSFPMTTLTDAKSLIRWYEQPQSLDAIQESRNSGKPLFIDFFALHCKGCEKLEATTYQDARVASVLNEAFIPVLYNARQPDVNFELLNCKALYAFSPVLITRAADGTEMRRTTGYLPPEDMLLELKIGLAFHALHLQDYEVAYRLLDAGIREHASAKNIPEALWWRGVAAYRKSSSNLLELAEAWAPLVRDYPDSAWADRADILGAHCEC
jgi:thiol-disulfide isomerase/thioredoxin